jgi:PTH1 family peptidyl-tRNA hydrolase
VENLHLIVGLGNPGAEYSETRHNVGFLLVERLAQAWQAVWRNEKKFCARLARAERHGRKVLLCEPQTFMNSSGEAVAAVARFYDVPLSRLLVVVDDADLPLGGLRLRPSGGTGGHHGLESIEQQMGAKDYARLRVGIGRRTGAREITGHVLGRFGSTETGLLDKVLDAASGQVETWVESGIQKAMNEFNGVIEDSENERTEQ